VAHSRHPLVQSKSRTLTVKAAMSCSRQRAILRGFFGIYPTGYIGAMQAELKDKMSNRMNRIAGQIAGIKRMIEADRYCVDILNQISAARSALDALGIELLSNHLETCVVGHGTGSEHQKRNR
jgi:CsoR family transcriptional regulator, copper-sensing transcriptional repressor